jgi:3-oxoacyl-[acyl-carrier protein] reductase
VRLAQKVALVTGASRGIGRAIALALAQEGARLVINYVHRADAAREVKDAVQALGQEALTVQADVAVADGWRAWSRRPWTTLAALIFSSTTPPCTAAA